MFPRIPKRIFTAFFTLMVVLPLFFFLPIDGTGRVQVAEATSWWTTPLWGPGSGNSASSCGILSWDDFQNCIANVVKLFVLDIPKFFFGITGTVFDVLIAFSLSSGVIQNQKFVSDGWIIMRDLSNTFFIFALLYIAIATILQTAGGQTKRFLATLIIAALFMNFSLYITKFVIDIGNVFALEFYQNISGNTTPYITIPGPGAVQIKSIAAGFNSAFSLENMPVVDTAGNLGAKIFIFLFIGILYLVAIFVFLSAAFLFLARVVAFWFLMILSPLAFFSMILPFTRSKIYSRWLSELISQSFFAPIFLFFVYLSLRLAEAVKAGTLFGYGSGSTTISGTTVSFIPELMLLFLKFFAIIMTLLFGLKTARSMSGTIGDSMLKMGGSITGAAVGGAALAGRQTIGRYAQHLLDTKGEQWKQSRTGQLWLSSTDKIAKSSFDARSSKLGQTIQSNVGGINLGSAGGAGGYAKDAAARAAANKKMGDSLKNNPAAWAKYIASLKKVDIEANINGERHGVRVNPDRDALAYWETLSARERQEAKLAAAGTDKDYLNSLDSKLVENYKGGFSEKQKKAAEKEARTFDREITQKQRVADLKLVHQEYKDAQNDAAKTAAKEKGKALVEQMKGKEIAELDGELLSSDIVAHHLTDKDLEEVERYADLEKRHRDAFYANIKSNGTPEAQAYLNLSPALQRRNASRSRRNSRGATREEAPSPTPPPQPENPPPTPPSDNQPPPEPNNNANP